MKYDVLLDMNSNDSHTIMLKQIKKGSKVLEFGSANGKMTQYMKETLGCDVYIVEYDKEMYESAIKYATDGICGDIVDLEWLKWSGISFDYILFGDVLEHLVNPNKIIIETEKVIKSNGKIIISIPNVTHNDVILKACNERFDYTPLGLLDETHVHFWGEKNLDSLVKDTQYYINNFDYTLWDTGKTEQAIDVSTELNRELVSVLNERDFGNVYQFIVTLSRDNKIVEENRKKVNYNEYCRIYFAQSEDFQEDKAIKIYAVKHEYKRYSYDFSIEVPKGTRKILIKPAIKKRCILDKWKIKVNEEPPFFIVFSDNMNINKEWYCFLDEEPFILMELENDSINSFLEFSADIVLEGKEYVDYFCKGWREIHMNESKELLEKMNSLIERIDLLDKKIEEKQIEKEDLEKYITDFEQKLNKVNENIEEKFVSINNEQKKNSVSIDNIKHKCEQPYNLIDSKINVLLNNTSKTEREVNELNKKLTMLLERVSSCSKTSKINIFSKNSGDISIIDSSYYFDWKWYVNRYNLKISNSIMAAQHYLEKGWKLFYDPSPYFVTIAYLITNWDVKVAECNPLLHYEKCGKDENRNIGNTEAIKEEYRLIRQSKYFDENWYRENYKLDDNMDAVYHFLFIGMGEYYNPSVDFSSLDYLMDNIHDVGQFQNPLVHYERNKNSKKNIVVKTVKETAENKNFENCSYVNIKEKEQLLDKKTISFERNKKTVDIVICVYNAYEDVKRCIESVLEHTSEPYRIIIVDDNSAELTASYLKEVADKNGKIKLIRNESELHGYTYAANIGLRNSDADYCVMLNSDTIVSDNWIDNMMACAESDEKIGVVGPLSNTASWQSVPKLTDEDGDWCHNVIPEDFTISDVARMIQVNSAKIYPKVPLLNGFCLMIKREVINEIGYFDEENFGRGFAEEDDYNTRAVKAGYKLAIADDTYVFHAQSKSYTDEKRLALCKLSGESLRKKHGHEYIDNCSTFMATNIILDSIRKRVEVMFEKERIYRKCIQKYSGKKILFLLPGSNASGGANVIIQESKALINMGVDVTILNLENNRAEYNKAYESVNIPVIWIKDYAEFDYNIAKNYDLIVCTLFRTVEYCKFLESYEKPKVAYYIQDYEPYFIMEEIKDGDYDHEEFERAKKSYTLIPSCINVTKTQWNSDEVKKHTGADCFILGPSLNTNLFMPRVVKKNPKVVITAMIRPSTKRRAPQMTFDVLRKIALEFGDKVSIRIFGADPEHDLYSKLFFAKQKKDFEYINYGLTSPEVTSRILTESDVFLDLSEFQAMGLTAMEAMACGCATIVPQNGGTNCFARNGENCLVIDTMNFEECLENTKKLLVDRTYREQIGRTAYKDMSVLYPEKVAERLLKVVFDNQYRGVSDEQNM